MDNKTNNNKPGAVLLLLQGMGNALLATPLINILSKDYLLDVITWRNGTEQLLLNNPNITNIYSPQENTFIGLLRLIVQNKLFGYNITYEAFPPGEKKPYFIINIGSKREVWF